MASLFLTLGAAFLREGDRLYIEGQTISGLKAWQQNFDRVVAVASTRTKPIPKHYVPVDEAGLNPDEIRLMPLPDGYHRPTYRRVIKEVKAQLLTAMQAADYCVFSFGGWPGDWGEVCARLSRQNGIPHAIWLDRVESQVVLNQHDGSLSGRLKSVIKSRIIAYNENRALAGADLSMLHGKTVYDVLRGRAANPCRSENIHFEEHDRIPPDEVTAKRAQAAEGPLRILYTGRADTMKGPFLWLDTLAELKARGVAFEARWLGAGPLLEELQARVAAEGLDGQVAFEGFVADRDAVRAAQRWAQVFLFCHLTDESPRAPIEALYAATPLVGFSDPFAADLVEEKGAGDLVARGDVTGLADVLQGLAGDRATLQDLIDRAHASARNLTRSKVFAERAAQVKANLRERA
jgi:glycosyltransferase involved in cell wall biosynthesis